MLDFKISAQSPLSGYELIRENIQLTEIVDLSLISIVTPLGQEQSIAELLSSQYKTETPKTGFSTLSSDKRYRFLGLQPSQFFVAFYSAFEQDIEEVFETFNSAYCTDQSDAWVKLRLSGSLSRAALERVCMLDQNTEKFKVGAAFRTVIEHMNAIVIREDRDTFILMSPRSSSKSFIDAIETSIQNIS